MVGSTRRVIPSSVLRIAVSLFLGAYPECDAKSDTISDLTVSKDTKRRRLGVQRHVRSAWRSCRRS